MILQGLVNYYERLESTGEVAPPGYSAEKISFVVVLDAKGEVVDVTDLRDHSGKRPQLKTLFVPRPVKRTSGIASNFLWDKTAYVFGRSATSKRATEEQTAFHALHSNLLGNSHDEGLRSLRLFLDTWDASGFDALKYAEDLLDQNVVFRLDGDRAYMHERPTAKGIWAAHLASGDVETGLCLVTGETGPIARLHPAIKGVPGAQSSGASIVSFNLDAFTSFGKDQGANAPVSEGAAHGYTTALNSLLSHDSGTDTKTGRRKFTNRVQIGDATTVFWAEATGGPEATASAEKLESLFATLLEPATDEQEAAKLHVLLLKIEQGRPLKEIDPHLVDSTRFYVLGLSPNAARLSVRFFIEKEFGRLTQSVGQHFRDMRIEPSAWRDDQPPSVYLLALQTAPMRRKDGRVVADAKKMPSNLIGEMLRAVLEGHRYPRSVLSTILGRFRADRVVTSLRVALVKANLIRGWRISGAYRYGLLEETTLVALEPDHPSVGYQLGRLFATYERAQAACFDDINSTVTDKFYASASTTPAYVFPGLERNFRNHLSKIGKGRNLAKWVTDPGRLRGALEIAAGRILSNFNAAFPHQLSLDEQGLFVLGYYHEKFTRRSSQTEAAASEDLSTDTSEGNQP